MPKSAFSFFIIHQRSDFIIHYSLRKAVLMNDEHLIMKNEEYKIKNPPIFISGFPILVEVTGYGSLSLFCRPLRAVAPKPSCSRLHSPQNLSRFCGCFDEPAQVLILFVVTIKKDRTILSDGSIFFGRGDRIRTCGLCVPNAALYQTEPHLDKLLNFAYCKFFLFYGSALLRS